jgi:uncharacterized repeat protein (TIGR01451 family)
MKKTLLFLIAILFSYSSVFAQSGATSVNNTKHDSITSVSCIMAYSVTYDSLMFIPDGPNCSGLSDCYNTFVTYTTFPAGAVITDAADILSVCMTIEHSYLGDLQFRLVCPNGNSTITHIQPNGGSLYLGNPIDDAGGCFPDASASGIGWNYCWSENPGYSFHGTTDTNYLYQKQTLPNCDSTDRVNHLNYYKPMNSFSSLVGCPLNGTWSLEICDLFAIDDGWISQWSLEVSHLSTFATGGRVFWDMNEDCEQASFEMGLANRTAVIQPLGVVIQTNSSGFWWVDSLPFGNYTMTIDTTTQWISSCPSSQSFSVSDSGITVAPCFGLKSTTSCPEPNVTIYTPSLRPCMNQTIYVHAINSGTATGMLVNAYVDVTLDSMISVTGCSLPYTMIGPNTYHIQVGNLYPNQQTLITFNTTLSCNAILGQTICMEASISPIDTCILGTPVTPVFPDGVSPCNTPWDNSSLSVDGWCANDTIYFTITNTGDAVTGNMTCYTPVRVYVDGVLTYFDSLMIAGGQSVTYAYPGNGQTWILQTDQHPLHPGNSHPNAHVEACGNLGNWTPGLVNDFPLDDADPIVDIYCGTVTTSYDPNDKTGFPTGLGVEHNILPNQQLQYAIRFQNTGTDTAFVVIIRDTLDTDLNLFSVVPGVASHPYTFRMYGPRVMEWSFYQILLPDSNTNEPASHGFLTYTVNQNPNLAYGTTIKNSADIYFDHNEPVITNQTIHTIKPIQTIMSVDEYASKNDEFISIYPNPASHEVSVFVAPQFVGQNYTLYNYLGQPVCSGKLINQESKISLNTVSQGVYLLKIGTSHKFTLKIVKN